MPERMWERCCRNCSRVIISPLWRWKWGPARPVITRMPSSRRRRAARKIQNKGIIRHSFVIGYFVIRHSSFTHSLVHLIDVYLYPRPEGLDFGILNEVAEAK